MSVQSTNWDQVCRATIEFIITERPITEIQYKFNQNKNMKQEPAEMSCVFACIVIIVIAIMSAKM